MTIRDPGYFPRRRRPRDGAHPMRAGRQRPSLVLPAIGVGTVVLALALVFWAGLPGGGGGSSSPAPSALVGLASDGPSAIVQPATPGVSPSSPGSSEPPSGAPSPTPSPAPAAGPADVAIVPVVSFRSARTSVRASDVRAIAGGSGAFAALVLVDGDADGVLAALDLDRKALGKRLVTVHDARALAGNLARNRTRLGFLRADEVDASVRALAWGQKSLFGVDRVGKLTAWPLSARLAVVGGAAPGAYDPGRAWTLVAGGDILLDRGVSLAIRGSSRGADFPFDGGTATITGRCKDCSPMGWDLPYTRRTGNAGAVRDLFHGADVAIANFENPAPKSFRFHARGTVFSANPKDIAGLANAGIDWVSMANNHIGDAGRNGVLQTMASLEKYGIRHSGAGRNATDAHKAALVKVGDVTLGILGYDTIAARYNAGAGTPGSARMTVKALKADIAAARSAGADVVVVFPHWGIEYRAAPTARQQRLGRAAIDAGADMVIGNHPHWAEAMEVYKGKPIWYALGNLVFDQTWSEPTMEGITLELTFRGTDLVQVRMRPHVILGRAQPNFLDPAGAGKVVMTQVFNASKGLLAW